MRSLRFLAPAFALLVAASPASADPKNPTYDQDVLPVLRQHCVGCHGTDKQRGGLNVATFAAAMQGGSSGAVVTPGDPDKSRLYTLAAHKEEPKMPPKADKIPDAQLDVIRLWIEQGARENAASKAAIVSLARSWASEVVASGVTVNVISPAATDTPMLADPERAHEAPRLTPLGRLIHPDEVAALAAFVLSAEAAAITGQDIAICGGASLPR